MYTYQDFTKDVELSNVETAVAKAIGRHKAELDLRIARTADEYDHQQNSTIMNFVRMLYNTNGTKKMDPTASNNKLCSNFFNRLNTQRMTYSLGNGVTFTEDRSKKALGEKTFDNKLRNAAYAALIHKVSFMFLNLDHVDVFKYTEFVALYDEETSALAAGIRYWQIDVDKPVMATLYEVDGYTDFKGNSKGNDFKVKNPKRAYKVTTRRAKADVEDTIISEENYSILPIVPLWGSRLHQSTLVGMRAKIDAFDLVDSGFADDMQECSEIYWMITNAGGMDDDDLARFRQRLKYTKVANVDAASDVSITPQTVEVPTEARIKFKDSIRAGIYEDFGALDVHTVAAGATNDHIDAAYQPLDENADDFEFQIIEAVQSLLAVVGIEDTPIFKRNRISNQKETVEMVALVGDRLDDETFLEKLPFITSDEVPDILAKIDESMGTQIARNTGIDEGE